MNYHATHHPKEAGNSTIRGGRQMEMFELLTHAMIGLGLAASCGFRVFVPLLVMGIAVRGGMIELTPGWQFIGSNAALVGLACATGLEILGFFIPWVDHLLDMAATPAAVVAGTIAMGGCVAQMSPVFQWSLAVIAGGGAAGLVQVGTVATRGASTATTGGIGNFLVAGMELVMSLVVSVLAVVVPFLTVGLMGLFLGFVGWKLYQRRRKRLLKASIT